MLKYWRCCSKGRSWASFAFPWIDDSGNGETAIEGDSAQFTDTGEEEMAISDIAGDGNVTVEGG